MTDDSMNLLMKLLTNDEQAIELLDKLVQDNKKYSWHDVVADPSDLPPHRRPVEVVIKNGTHKIAILVLKGTKDKWFLVNQANNLVGMKGKVDAWRYLKPFKREVSEDKRKN